MALFKNPVESHAHSLNVLNLLYEYDSFLDSLQVICDMGCGAGLDAQWWAELASRDDVPVPHNYLVYAVDQNIQQLEPAVKSLSNVVALEGDFHQRLLPRKADLIWAHDVFQYSRDPFKCLAAWKESMNENGMLILSVPQTTYFDHTQNKLVLHNHNHQYFNYNLLNLVYLLAVSGFDCRDAYFYREPNTPWLYAAVYASSYGPLDRQATWYDLVERNLLNDSMIASLNKNGYMKLEDIIVTWLDKDNYLIAD